MTTRYFLTIASLIVAINGFSQVSSLSVNKSSDRKVAFRSRLGRISIYNEFLGFGTGLSFNVAGSPIMTDIMNLNIGVGAGNPSFEVPIDDKTSIIYRIESEFGRRRSRLIVAGGLWQVVSHKQIRSNGDTSKVSMELNLFGSIGYRYQAPYGLLFGTNLYLIGGQSDYAPDIHTRSNYPVFSVWPSVYFGYRIPSTSRHKELVAYSKLSGSERLLIKQNAKRDKLVKNRKGFVSDSTKVWRNSEFGVSVFGPALITAHYTLYVPLSNKGAANYYIRTGIGTAVPLIQLHVEMGMAFLWNNNGFLVGGGVAGSWAEPSVDPLITIKGKVNMGKGFSGNAGINLQWSLGTPYKFINKIGKPYVLPTFGISYRLRNRGVNER